VGVYDAVTLKATDTPALEGWLKVRGYKFKPDQSEWLSHYVRKGWFLTAFQYKPRAKAVSSDAIRMTFKSERPYCPYYVPESNLKFGHAPLRIFLVAGGDVDARVGKDEKWSCDPTNIVPFITSQRTSLARALKISASAIPKLATVTFYGEAEFESSCKDDLFFSIRPRSAR
jgi:hypothetical protein